MKGKSSKLATILKHRAHSELEAVREYRRIDEVLRQRCQDLAELETEKLRLLREIDNLRGPIRHNALQAGNGRFVATVGLKIKALQGKVQDLEKLILEKKSDVELAKNRTSLANRQMIDARIEKKKVQTLLDNNKSATSITAEERDQQNTEELLNSISVLLKK